MSQTGTQIKSWAESLTEQITFAEASVIIWINEFLTQQIGADASVALGLAHSGTLKLPFAGCDLAHLRLGGPIGNLLQHLEANAVERRVWVPRLGWMQENKCSAQPLRRRSSEKNPPCSPRLS